MRTLQTLARLGGIAVLSFATLVAAPLFAHGVDPLEHAPAAPAPNAAVEQFSGTLRDLVINDRVANASLRYRWLELPDDDGLMLRGDALAGLAAGTAVEVTGRRNGKTVFATGGRTLPPQKSTAARTRDAEVEGELRMVHLDYFEDGRSRFEFEVLDERGDVTPLKLPVRPEALQRGMRVLVRGGALADGSIAPSSFDVLALPAAESTSKTGLKATVTNRALVILIRFADSGAQPFTQAQVQATFAGGAGSSSVTEYFREVSYGQQLLSATVTPWLSSSSATPANCDWRTMGTLARNAANAAGYNTASYQNLVYVFPRVPACGWAGLGYVGAGGMWANGQNSLLVYAHELGHNFGLLHAGSMDCGSVVLGGTCSGSEYGDPFDVMGNQRAMHYNATQKSILGWIGTANVATHTGGNATYTLSPLESAGGSTYAIKVRVATNRTYWLEYRQPIGFDAGLASYPNNGAQVRVAAPFEALCGGCDAGSTDTEILDMTPATSTFTDAALLAGRSYTDSQYGVTFNVLSSTPGALTVQVASGGSTATTSTALASSLNPSPAGTPVAFTATVTGASPTGTVAFTANATAISGCAAVALTGSGNTRTASCTTSSLATGTQAIVARYGGNPGNNPSTSATLSQIVNSTTPPPSGTNVALASAGATASASSTAGSGYAVSGVIDNERTGFNWGANGGWKDGTVGVFPDWAQVDFAGSRTIDRVVVFSVQDSGSAPIEPTDTTTFSQWGVTDFTVQGWNGSSWVTLGSASGNNRVKRSVTFAAFTTTRIRVNVTGGLAGASRITEVQAWSSGATPPPPPPTSSNVALASAGATASASSTAGSGYAAAGAIDNERTGINWGAGGGWKDGTSSVFPDWLQVDFNGTKSIDRVVVFSVQDSGAAPVEPTDTTRFTQWGLTDFTVQGWNGSSWVTLGTVSGNNLVKRTVTFAPFATSRIRVNATGGLAGASRITEVQAWGTPAAALAASGVLGTEARMADAVPPIRTSRASARVHR